MPNAAREIPVVPHRPAALAAGLALAALLAGCSTPGGGPAAGGGRAVPASEIRFERMAPFVQMATVTGDRAKGPHGTFGIFEAGAASPPHTHTAAYDGVVISGVMTNPFGVEPDPPRMGPGSYWHVPAGAVHVTACVSAEPCRFFFHSADAFDFHPVDALTGLRAPGSVARSAGSLRFEEVAPFVRMADAWGDRATGAHGTFGIFRAGAASPRHTHTHAYHGVVISGTMTNPFAGETDPPRMGPGSYWYVPGGAEHVTACVSAEPCRFYFYSEGAFDFFPVEQ